MDVGVELSENVLNATGEALNSLIPKSRKVNAKSRMNSSTSKVGTISKYISNNGSTRSGELELDDVRGDVVVGHRNSTPQLDRPSLRPIDKYIRPECSCLTKRVTVALLACVGFVVIFGMGYNVILSRYLIRRKTDVPFPMVESPMYWGYLITQIPGGFLATKYPANKLFGGAIVMSSLLYLLVPVALTFGPVGIVIVRTLQGLFEGVAFPACYGMWRYWAPPLERSRLATLALCGSYAGILLGKFICRNLIIYIGWETPFYFYGCFGIVWYLAWLWLVFERPNKHTTIDVGEIRYIESSMEESVSNNASSTVANTPWKNIVISLPVWAIFIANFCWTWNFFLLVSFQVFYIRHVYDIEIKEIGILEELPYLIMTIMVPSGGILADYLKKQGVLTTTQVRKMFNCGGFVMEATFLLIIAFSKSYVPAITALTFGIAFSSFAISGFNVNHLDIAPKYTSILIGMSNVIGILAGYLSGEATFGLTYNENATFGYNKNNAESWKRVFLLAATIHYLGAIFYGIFASGDLQPWAGPCKTEEENQGNLLNVIDQKTKSPTVIILVVFSVVCILSLVLTISLFWF